MVLWMTNHHNHHDSHVHHQQLSVMMLMLISVTCVPTTICANIQKIFEKIFSSTNPHVVLCSIFLTNWPTHNHVILVAFYSSPTAPPQQQLQQQWCCCTTATTAVLLYYSYNSSVVVLHVWVCCRLLLVSFTLVNNLHRWPEAHKQPPYTYHVSPPKKPPPCCRNWLKHRGVFLR